jgi:WD40 repeat protein
MKRWGNSLVGLPGKTSAILVILLIGCSVIPTAGMGESLDVTTLNLLWDNSEGHNATLWSVRWSPDDSMISATYFDNTTTIFNARNGSIITKMGSHPKPPRGSRCDGIQDCKDTDHWPTRVSAWSPDGQYLATGGDNRLIIIYETTNWTIAKILEGHDGSVLTLEWSPGGTMIASGSGTDKVGMHNLPENLIKIWDFSTGDVIADLVGHNEAVMNVKWSPNGSMIASASDDKMIMLWSTSDWTRTKTLTGHVLGVLDVDWSPNGTQLVSGSRDYKVRTWDVESGISLQRWTEPNCVRSVHWHPSGEIIANSGVDETVLKIRNGTTGTVIKTYTESAATNSVVMSSRWSHDGNKLAAGAGLEHTLRVYAFGTSAPPEKEGIPQWIPGTIIFLAICAAGIFLIMLPIFRRLGESGR